MNEKPLKFWALSDGRKGMAHQALGLAEALAQELGGSVDQKTAALRGWRGDLPEELMVSPMISALKNLDPAKGELTAPWPDVVVGCGRQAVGLSLAIKRAAESDGRRIFTVQTQDPRVSPDIFDAVVPPAHDDIAGENVSSTLGAVNHVTPARLAEGRVVFEDTFAPIPRPLVAVLIGGSSRAYRLDRAAAEQIAGQLATLQKETGCGILLTTSRRTGAENEAVLRDALAGPATWIWDGQNPNPYFGMLALADHILVTADSTNMITEAAATGSPISILNLPGGNAKFARLHQSLRVRGIARPFEGKLEHWTYVPLLEAHRVATKIAPRIREKLALAPAALAAPAESV